MYKDKVIEILDDYILKNKEIINEYKGCESLKSLYESLFDCFKNATFDNLRDNGITINAILDSIYGKDAYKNYYDIIYEMNSGDSRKFNELNNRLHTDYDELNKRMEALIVENRKRKHFVSSANKFINCINNGTVIEDIRDVDNIKKIIGFYRKDEKISSRMYALLINEIDNYNRLTSSKGNAKEEGYAKGIYAAVPSVLEPGYELPIEVSVSPEQVDTLNSIIKEILSFIDDVDLKEINDVIDSYKKYNFKDNEFNYVLNGLLNKYINDMFSYYGMIIDNKTRWKREDLLSISAEYGDAQDRYLIIRDYYNKFNDIKEELPSNEVTPNSNGKRIIYSYSSVNPEKAKIISDFDDIPSEFYGKVNELLSSYKNGTIPNKKIKHLDNGPMELKDDQVRIVLKHARDDIYVVLGAFIKKANNARSMYYKMFDRTVPNIDTDEKLDKYIKLAEITDKEIEDIVNGMGRKFTR